MLGKSLSVEEGDRGGGKVKWYWGRGYSKYDKIYRLIFGDKN